MQQNLTVNKQENSVNTALNQMNYVIGDEEMLSKMKQACMFEPFAVEILAFLNCVSKSLLENKEAKQYADVVSLGFWCRKSSLEKLRIEDLERHQKRNEFRLGKGIVFHVAPSNVALNFAYSMIAGLLAGNPNIVRLPSKEFEQVKLVCAALEKALQEFPDLRPYLILVQYGHDKVITDELSSLCSTRVVWGGNETIATIRKSPLGPRANEICFSDRYSISILQADRYLARDDKAEVARKFFNDTYLNDQNACTSPKLVVWMGERVKEAQELFWSELHKVLKERYELNGVQAVDKLVNLYKLAAGVRTELRASFKQTADDNLITRVEISEINEEIMAYECKSGFFLECTVNELKSILPVCRTELQTVGVLGIEEQEIRQFLENERPSGIDRFTEIGNTLNFDLIWDGYDLIGQMTRCINILK